MPSSPTPATKPLPAPMPSASERACAAGIDWGTTNRRGFLLDVAGRCMAVHADDDGMLHARGRFADSLRTMLEALDVADMQLPVLMAGMVGSANGWVEVPYVTAGEPLITLRQRLHRFDADGRSLAIVPGCVLNQHGRVDVMRGEETQLLGALAQGHGDGWYLLPGTHSKWVHLEGGAITDFATFMTGELFALLSQHGTLAAALASPGSPSAPAGQPAPSTPSRPTEPSASSAPSASSTLSASSTPPGHALQDMSPGQRAFEAGLHAAAAGALSNVLFGCRARVVTGRLRPEDACDHLSVLLIGAEWYDIAQRHGGKLPAHVRAIGTPELVRRHAQAAAVFGVPLESIDAPQATVAGLAMLLGLMPP